MHKDLQEGESRRLEKAEISEAWNQKELPTPLVSSGQLLGGFSCL